MRTFGYIIGSTLGLTVIIIIVNFLFFRGNTPTKDNIDSYINGSKIINVKVNDFKVNSQVYFPKLQRFGDGTKTMEQFVFYSDSLKKYLTLITFYGYDYNPNLPEGHKDKNRRRLSIMYYRVSMSARIHPFHLNNPLYGTQDNPIPIFGIELLDIEKNKSLLEKSKKEFEISESTNRIFVEQYLTHFVDKLEFKKLFNID